jgi:methionine aminopeptidase
MREAGRIVRVVLDAVEAACVPGVTTAELNAIAERELRRGGDLVMTSPAERR